MQTIKHYSDPSHGWFAVKRQALINFGLTDKVTKYSYQRGATVYLEEDCDATLYLNALRERGIEYTIEEKYTDKSHPIRSYERFVV
jgi:hypothetical protein